MPLQQGTTFLSSISSPSSHTQSHDDPVRSSAEGQVGKNADEVIPAATKLFGKGTCEIYSGPGRKPQFLMQLESYVSKELQTISNTEPTFPNLKLQIFQNVFGQFIKEFKTYLPLLSAIKNEYENTLAFQKDQIGQLESLRSHMSLITEECDRKIKAHWEEQQAGIRVLKREKQQLEKDLEAMSNKEKTMQEVVDRLKVEVSNQYLQYREERDARKVLIWQLNDLSRGLEEEDPPEQNAETKDPLELQLMLKVCREDLTKAQDELINIKAKYWDVVPRRDWDQLTQTHTQTLQQLKTLQGDYERMKSEYDVLADLHTKGRMQNERQDFISDQAGQERSTPNEI